MHKRSHGQRRICAYFNANCIEGLFLPITEKYLQNSLKNCWIYRLKFFGDRIMCVNFRMYIFHDIGIILLLRIYLFILAAISENNVSFVGTNAIHIPRCYGAKCNEFYPRQFPGVIYDNIECCLLRAHVWLLRILLLSYSWHSTWETRSDLNRCNDSSIWKSALFSDFTSNSAFPQFQYINSF